MVQCAMFNVFVFWVLTCTPLSMKSATYALQHLQHTTFGSWVTTYNIQHIATSRMLIMQVRGVAPLPLPLPPTTTPRAPETAGPTRAPPLGGGATPKTTWPRPAALEVTSPLPTPTTLWAPETAGALSLRVATVPPPPPVPMAAIYNEAEADTTIAEVIRGRGGEGERDLGGEGGRGVRDAAPSTPRPPPTTGRPRCPATGCAGSGRDTTRRLGDPDRG